MEYDLFTQFRDVIERYRKPSSQIVLALSGGLDSRAMLHLLRQYQDNCYCTIQVVHVHHGLSSNADYWAKQCADWCHEVGFPFHLEKVDLGNLQGESIEQVARSARYEALKHYIGSDDLLLTAQHADDQLETFLLALKRGSGPKGLSGMAECMGFGAGYLVRPFLKASRQSIEKYSKYHDLKWVEDESNADERFDRNYIRHQVTPVLSSRWPHIRKAVQRSAELCYQQEELIRLLLADELHRVIETDYSLNIDGLRHKPTAVIHQLIRYWLEKLAVSMPSQRHLEMIWDEVALAKADANPQLKLQNNEIRRFNQRLYCTEIYNDISLWTTDVTLNVPVQLPDNLGVLSLVEKSNSGCLSNVILQQRLRVIFNPEGLKATPLHKHGKKTLKFWFQEYGVPSWLRRRTPILMAGNDVVAVGDLFINQQYAGDSLLLNWQHQ
ncbi:tRNA lysidine(34) synthetase TilS [Vibrio viridaestus]|uniref:tRNA(Ile)-lysidine synthase n=1 Tax=Vibrio viridaestus TaxID=2487322 RepID=A0A3N9U733_9VIBR|nr:tRNA lysidine(34) synthetase TilS [Vibrio viridaestus]RQW63956.1 tRNA lysidine(34) synthetase TilS [Vibrio viridaestus]